MNDTGLTGAPAAAGGRRLGRLLGQGEIFLSLAVVLVIAIMIVPLPAIVLDLLITLSLSISITVLLIALYVQEPLQFSVFPSLLLIVTLFRLALNISSARLILLDGYAGQVIQAFGHFVIGGNYVVGIVVFLLLMIIQFAVITNGAGRVAEVAARFTLDAMPGKQMSIDADLNAGLINEAEARRRRRMIETEADFYGAMDGSSKFVKGDAIAGVAIILVNIIGGFAIGVMQKGMDLATALQTYTLLTVGDGLVAQVPALLVSTATGIIVTRASSEAGIGNDVISQLLSNPRVIGLVGAILLVFGLVPGLPKLPFLLIGGLGVAGYLLSRNRMRQPRPEPETAAPSTPLDTVEEVFDLIKVDPLAIELGYGLIPLVEDPTGVPAAGNSLLDQVSAIRKQIALELGAVLPKIRIRDNLRLGANAYAIKLRDEVVAEGELHVSRLLAMPGAMLVGGAGSNVRGVETREPVYGLPALWIEPAEKERAAAIGYTVVDPSAVLTTHLAETIRQHAADLLTRQEVQKLLDHLAKDSPVLVQEASSDQVGLVLLQRVLQNLLAERVSIRDLDAILEVVTARSRETRDADILSEHVRQALARSICNQYRDPGGVLYVVTIGPMTEQQLAENTQQSEGGLMTSLSPEIATALLQRAGEEVEKMAQAGHVGVLLCSARTRLVLRRFTQRSLPQVAVLSYSEIPAGVEVYACGMVEVAHGA